MPHTKQPHEQMMDSLLPLLPFLASLQQERSFALRAAQVGAIEAEAAFEMQATLTSLAFEAVEKEAPHLKTLLPQRFMRAFELRVNEAFRVGQPPEILAEWYERDLETPLQQATLNQLASDPTLSVAQIGALTHAIAALSSLAQLRDLGLSIYARAEMTAEDAARLKSLATSCLSRERLFLGLADESVKRQMDEALRATMPKNLAQTDEWLRQMKSGQGKSLFANTPQALWLEQMDSEMTTRHEALYQIVSRLKAEGAQLAALNAPGQALDSDVEQALPAIASLPLCRGLSETALRSLLKGARIQELDKNESFLIQGEPTSRLFVLMEGWAKLTKTTDEGEEAILQLLGKKDAALDNAFLSGGLSAVNGRAVAKAKLLALSLPALRETAARHRELAQNLLAATSARLQKLVAHFEQITLRDATQRVGWFLVGLHLETGLDGAPLKLPFDKALIAAYLNIKPETFSRVLQKFRQQGFKIGKHEIVMPHPQALCAYCDPDMALRCCRAETVNCAPIRAAKRAEGQG